jgi:putative ABC transport system ATP-binding protein
VALLLDAQREIGATLVVVTHDPMIATKMERLVSLRNGSIVQDSGADNAC